MTIELQFPRPERPLTATAFINDVAKLTNASREAAAVDAILAGHLPDRLREMVDIELSVSVHGTMQALVVSVSRDYLCIGTDNDFLRMPMSPIGAQKVADACGCMLPTTRLVSTIWQHAPSKLAPSPWGPPYDASMMSTSRFVAHNWRINDSIEKYKLDRTALLSGHKKDVVLTNALAARPAQVAIFGWHQLNGKPIQPLSLVHEAQYADYSHGVRMISLKCVLDGIEDDLRRILQDPVLCHAVSDEGPLHVLRQPGT